MTTLDEILAAPLVDGWHMLPDGRRIKIGSGCEIGSDCKIASQPLLIRGLIPYRIAAVGPKKLQIGCEVHTLDGWEEDVERICEKHTRIDMIEPIRTIVLPFVRQWFDNNPNVIVQI